MIIESKPTDEMEAENGYHLINNARSPKGLKKKAELFEDIRNPAGDYLDQSRQKMIHKILYGHYPDTNNDENSDNEDDDVLDERDDEILLERRRWSRQEGEEDSMALEDSRDDIVMAFRSVESTLDQALGEILNAQIASSKGNEETTRMMTMPSTRKTQQDLFDRIMGTIETALCLSSDIPTTSTTPWAAAAVAAVVEKDILDIIFQRVEKMLRLSSSLLEPKESVPSPPLALKSLEKNKIIVHEQHDALDVFFEGIEAALCRNEHTTSEEPASSVFNDDWYLGDDIPFDCAVVETKEDDAAIVHTKSFLGTLLAEFQNFLSCTPSSSSLSAYEARVGTLPSESSQKLPNRSQCPNGVAAELNGVVSNLSKDSNHNDHMVAESIFSERCRERFEEYSSMSDSSTTINKPLSMIQSMEHVTTVMVAISD